MVNCAGLVDFNPDVRAALEANVQGALRVAEFAKACDRAALLHVSTCYVAGSRDGFVPEKVRTDVTPNGSPISAASELEQLRALITDVEAENESAATANALREQVLDRIRERGQQADERRVNDMVGRLKRKRLREMMAIRGTERAKELGWPNTYT